MTANNNSNPIQSKLSMLKQTKAEINLTGDVRCAFEQHVKTLKSQQQSLHAELHQLEATLSDLESIISRIPAASNQRDSRGWGQGTRKLMTTCGGWVTPRSQLHGRGHGQQRDRLHGAGHDGQLRGRGDNGDQDSDRP